MKKLLAILIILLLLFNSMGYYIVFKTVQFAIKNEIKNKIKHGVSDENLSLIKVAFNDENKKAEIEWLEEHEFLYGGQMYDVVKSYTSNDTSYYYCINDKQEEQLFSALDKHIKNNTDQNLPLKEKSNNLLKSIVKQAIFNYNSLFSINESKYEYSLANSKQLNDIYKNVPTPPPKS